MAPSKKGLGKGLGALIAAPEQNDFSKSDGDGVINIDINKIEPNSEQPRKRFDIDSINDMAESIRAHGVIQPVIVKSAGDGFYSLIAGERRWRAARVARLDAIPAIVKDYTDVEALQVALIENLQREDLNPIEQAVCYKRLADEYFYTQEDIASKIGKSRNSVSYALGLLNLDARVQSFVADGSITPGHARYLFHVKNPDDQFSLAQFIMAKELNVRETEKYVKSFLANRAPSIKKTDDDKRIYFSRLESDLQHMFGTKVTIKNGKNKGKIEIEYYSDEELDRILNLFKRSEE
ncbi:MAG: ParB/RepB/Spo0J family partition protein [Clostridiales bacterium]|nr:ParB/RepB/Spo0J family partition protein [Clostridiales bacterium]